ncbi:mycothiol system anti-sigma-R factor [Kocuria sp. JC486]|uniref:Mycothiol system anti-sigma-R factor n=1 Tax=Kocuria soli TaxID=2485125 RepID=A0A3N3ZPV5_9MICC|nr:MULTISPECIES: mycothiol system anti-sigma-R factor [Kocuria]NHU84528.1 mycothiol system anti-sigma-R factor [Kocuria sp. JC486]ROZ63057.1 mycothiol system anti-sigma-R factor [Kocuria soli]
MNEQAIQKESTAPSAPLDGAAAPCGCSGEQVERIYEYLDGALTVEDLKEIAAHLESCEDCTHESELEQVIRTVVKRSCSETAPDTLRSAIMTRIHEACGETPRG